MFGLGLSTVVWVLSFVLTGFLVHWHVMYTWYSKDLFALNVIGYFIAITITAFTAIYIDESNQ